MSSPNSANQGKKSAKYPTQYKKNVGFCSEIQAPFGKFCLVHLSISTMLKSVSSHHIIKVP
jgi:hypothetical protein